MLAPHVSGSAQLGSEPLFCQNSFDCMQTLQGFPRRDKKGGSYLIDLGQVRPL